MPKRREPRSTSEGAPADVVAAGQPGDVILSLTPEPSAVEEPLPRLPASPEPSAASEPESVLLRPDAAQLRAVEQESQITLPGDIIYGPRPVASEPMVADSSPFGTEARHRLRPRPARSIDRLGQWFSPRVLR